MLNYTECDVSILFVNQIVKMLMSYKEKSTIKLLCDKK